MRLEAIKSKQKRIFKKLHHFPEFYLAGGTGLALQIGHRVSVDFDLFCHNLPKGLIEKVKHIFKESKIEIALRHSEQVTTYIDNVRVDFVRYKFPLVLKPVVLGDVKTAQVSEIAVMKAYALNFRGTLKDYVDLYFILKNNFATLPDINKLAEKKYGDDFNFRVFLEQLVYLDDIEEGDEKNIVFLGKKVDKDKIRFFFKQAVKNIKI